MDKSTDQSPILRSLDVLPRKCALLLSEHVQEQVDACTYFRRILALGRYSTHPPLLLLYVS